MIIYNFIRYWILLIRYKSILDQVDDEQNFFAGLSRLLGIEFKKAWFGRRYAIMNPYIKNGKFDPNSQVFELGSDDPSYKYVENVLMGNLDVINKHIHISELFDVIMYKIEKLDEYGNHLVQIYPAPLPMFIRWGKRFAWLAISLVIIAAIISVIFFI